MGAWLVTLVTMAARNLVARRTNLVIGAVLAAATAVLVVGSSVLAGMTQAVERSIVDSGAGHLQIFSSHSQDDVALFGSLNKEPRLQPLEDFAQVREVAASLPNVRALVPMGTVSASLSGGNLLDVTLSELRHQITRGGDLELRERLQRKLRHIARLLMDESEQLAAVSGGASPEALAALRQAASDAFWAELAKDPLGSLEFLENHLAPLLPERLPEITRLVGTDLEAFRGSFPRMELVEGKPVPAGSRGVLLNQQFYESTLKLKTARRLDLMRKQFLDGERFETSDALKQARKQNQNQVRELILQLEPEEVPLAAQRLQKLTGSERTAELSELWRSFLTMDDGNFLSRYDAFYKELAPLLELYRVRPGDVVAFTSTGRNYSRAIAVRVYGIVRFAGLEDSDIVGGLNFIDLVSFRELYGIQAMDSAAAEALHRAADIQDVPRDRVEDDLFGSPGGLVDTEPEKGFDEDVVFPSEPRARQEVDATYPVEQLQSGMVLNVAVVLHDPSKAAQTRQQMEETIRERQLSWRVIDGQKAAGVFGDFVGIARVVLLCAGWIAAVLALVIINNAMVMATLRRKSEFGTFRALGMQRLSVLLLVLLEAALLGGAAASAGVGLGVGLTRWIGVHGIPATEEGLAFFFGGSRLIPVLSLSAVLFVSAGMMAVAILSSLYPGFLAISVPPRHAMEARDT